MGFMDKVKAAAKNVDSKAGEEIDKGKYRSKISEEKNEIDKLYKNIGIAYYDARAQGKGIPDEIDDMCAEIDERKSKIAEYEVRIKEIEEAGHKEREQNRLEAEAASREREQNGTGDDAAPKDNEARKPE